MGSSAVDASNADTCKGKQMNGTKEQKAETPASTPGPWYAEMARNNFGDSFAGYWLVTGPNRAGVADCFGEVRGAQDEDGSDKHLPDTEVEANARLIAAAPDLLRLLKEWVRLTDSLAPIPLHIESTKAIAKTEGRA
jgi:hypothetical protein